MVINSTAGFQAVYEQMAKLKEAARKSGLFIVSDSDLDFNQPVVRVKIDRSKASDLGINMQQVGSTLATLLGGNYVNRFNLEGRSYQVIPQVPRGLRLSPEALGGYYVATATGQQVPLSTIVSIETATDPNALTHYNQLNSATFQAVPMPGVTGGQAADFLEGEANKVPAGFRPYQLAGAPPGVEEARRAVFRSASWWLPACRSARCSRCSCCPRSTYRSQPTTAPRPARSGPRRSPTSISARAR